MNNDELKKQLDRIEANTLLAAKNVLTISDLSILIGLKKDTIYRLTSSRRIPYYKQGKELYFNKKEIEDWQTRYRINTKYEAEAAAEKYIITKKLGV